MQGVLGSTDSSIIYELCQKDINAAILILGHLAVGTLLTNGTIYAQTMLSY